MEHIEIWNIARKLNLGIEFYEGLDTLLTFIEKDKKQLLLTGVGVRSEQLCDCVMPDPINPWDSVDKDTCIKCENKIA